MDMKSIFDAVAANAERNVQSQFRDDDYIGEDGLRHCGKCGVARQTKIHVFGQDRLVWCICDCEIEKLTRAEESRQREKVEMLKQNGFTDPTMTESVFAADEDPESEESRYCRNYVKEFDHFYERGKGLLLTGGVGTGKTFYATCVANALMEKLHPVLFTSVGRYIRDMENEFGGVNEKIDYLNRFALVVFDDFGVERNTQYINELVYALIDGRIRSGKPMIITTNISLEDMKNPGSIEFGRIYDRILSRCIPIVFSGRNKRRQTIRRDYGEDMALLKGGSN